MSDSQTPETTKTTETPQKVIRPPLSEEKRNELDHKYEFPNRMQGFTCYFGKYREKATFEEVAKDTKYCKYIMTLTPKNSNMYLFQRYYNTLPKEEEEPVKKTVKKKTK
jgi:hypothetical protein